MNFEEEIYRALRPSVSRSVRSVADGAIHFGTDIGLRRDENQDRVASLRWSSSDQNGASYLAIVICDGMGGMEGGADCASLASAAFLSAIAASQHRDIGLSLSSAAIRANDRVYRSYGGRGGSTISALIVSSGGSAIGVNIGDSRAYAFIGENPHPEVERLTTDDTLSEVFGRGERGLIQFVGMGSGIKPHIFSIPQSYTDVVLSSDGAHFVPPEIYAEIAWRAPDTKARTDRLLAFARWLGGHDNITVASINLPRAFAALNQQGRRPHELITPSGELSFLFLDKVPSDSIRSATEEDRLQHLPSNPKPRGKSRRRNNTKETKSKPEQLQIDIEVSQKVEEKE